MSEYADVRSDISKTWTFVGIILVLQFVGALALTAGQGFSDPQFTTRFIVYVLFAFIGLGFIVFGNYRNLQKHRHIFIIPLHEPEESLGVGRLKFFKNPVLLTLLALIVFTPVLLISAKYSNTFFSGIPFRHQEVSRLGNLWGDAGFPSISENLLMYIPIILLLSVNYYLFRRVKVLYWFNNIVTIPLIMAFVWRWFHNLVYGSNEFASYYTFIFGFVGVMLTLLTMSFVLWFVIHFLSNFMLSAKLMGILANDSFMGWVIGVWIILVLALITVNYYSKSKGVS